MGSTVLSTSPKTTQQHSKRNVCCQVCGYQSTNSKVEIGKITSSFHRFQPSWSGKPHDAPVHCQCTPSRDWSRLNAWQSRMNCIYPMHPQPAEQRMYDIANGFTGLRSKHPTRCAAILCSLSTHLSFYSCKDVFLVIFAHRIHVLRTFTYIYCTYIYHKKKQLNVGKYIYIHCPTGWGHRCWWELYHCRLLQSNPSVFLSIFPCPKLKPPNGSKWKSGQKQQTWEGIIQHWSSRKILLHYIWKILLLYSMPP